MILISDNGTFFSLVSDVLSVILIDSPSEMKLTLLLDMLSVNHTANSNIGITVSLVSYAISARRYGF